MTRSLCCLALTCFIAACAPKAVVIEEPPVPKPKQARPQPRSGGEEAPAVPRQLVQESGMHLPDLTKDLPDRKDMTPTAAPATGGGSTVIATPPTE